MEILRPHLEDKRQAGLYRTRNLCEGVSQIRRSINGKRVITFCSNDYLGLAGHPQIIQAFKNGVDQYGVGSGAATLINGYTPAHATLEAKLAELTGRSRALLFSTGYMANLGVVSTLAKVCDRIFEDRLNHASLLDGAQLSQIRFQRYRHLDYAGLDDALVVSSAALVVSEAVFSMDGDVAELTTLAKVCARHRAVLMIDDAHGFGVHGTHGAGTLQQYGLTQTEVPVLVGTFGKAIGTFGAFVAGDKDLIEMLIQTARTYIYTTALPPAVACATLASLDLIKQEPERREKLHRNICLFKQFATAAGLPNTHSNTAIQPIIVGDAQAAVAISNSLFAAGIQVCAIRPPTVPVGSARLRVTLSSQHEEADIELLVEQLAAHYERASTK